MDVVSNVGLFGLSVCCRLCVLSFLVETATTAGSKSETASHELTIPADDHDRPSECRISNSTIIGASVAYNNSSKQGGGERLLLALVFSGSLMRDLSESGCGRFGGGRLSIRWNWEEQTRKTEADRASERCTINTQLDLKWTNGTEEDDGKGGTVMDATLLLEISSLAHTPEETLLPSTAKFLDNGRGSLLHVYECKSIHQVAAQFDAVDGRQVVSMITCGSIDWDRIQVQLRFENRTEGNSSSGPVLWKDYELKCDLTKTQTTDAAENDRKMEPLSAPNPFTIYVATAFGVLVLCIVFVYFVVKNRRQGASYAAMSDD